MTPEQAVDFIVGVAAQANVPKQAHINVEVAANIIREALKPKGKKEK